MAEIAAGRIEALSQREVVLASETESRRMLLTAAGLSFRVVAPDVDEAAVHEVLLRDKEEMDPGDVAELLARKRAEETSALLPGALVIGADQTLSLNGRIFHKPTDFQAARDALFELRGNTHQLHSAVALAEGGQVTWTYIETAHLTMRPLSAQFVGRYLAAAGPQAYQSAGAYQLDGLGIQLFDCIEGDSFAILGLPLLNLLVRLREIFEKSAYLPNLLRMPLGFGGAASTPLEHAGDSAELEPVASLPILAPIARCSDSRRGIWRGRCA